MILLYILVIINLFIFLIALMNNQLTYLNLLFQMQKTHTAIYAYCFNIFMIKNLQFI
jgi:hypothetical protein